MISIWAGVHESMAMDRTNEMCTPSDLRMCLFVWRWMGKEGDMGAKLIRAHDRVIDCSTKSLSLSIYFFNAYSTCESLFAFITLTYEPHCNPNKTPSQSSPTPTVDFASRIRSTCHCPIWP
mmetsp:Transcript_20011/g.37672  ORF Transcript_20011/g.37672 Transcript_20011/m.37672 type:complete len:121 (+) Transcript_20011:463-825(+)